MTNDLKRKAAALLALAANFGKTMPEPLAEMWLKLLEPYSASEVEGAVRAVVEGYVYKTLPPFAELKKFLPRRGPAFVPPEEALRQKAEAEWERLLDSIVRCGYYNEPSAMHPTTAYVLRGMGGWKVACGWLESELHYRKDDFVKAFMVADGNVETMEGGAAAIERRQEAALSSVGGAVGRLRARMEGEA